MRLHKSLVLIGVATLVALGSVQATPAQAQYNRSDRYARQDNYRAQRIQELRRERYRQLQRQQELRRERYRELQREREQRRERYRGNRGY